MNSFLHRSSLVFLIILILQSLTYSYSFTFHHNRFSSTSRTNVQVKSLNYHNHSPLKMSNNNNSNNNSGQKTPFVMTEPKSSRDRAAFRNKIPFSEDMYNTMRKFIDILSKRIESNSPISMEESSYLLEAVDIIIDDAKKYGPPVKPVRTQN